MSFPILSPESFALHTNANFESKDLRFSQTNIFLKSMKYLPLMEDSETQHYIYE